MSKMHVERSIKINATKENVIQTLTDFETWKAWSPWLLMDENPSVTISQDGKNYQWKGKRTGEGKMEMLEVGDSSIQIDLNFIKPYKSQADVRFDISEAGDATEVTWVMDSSWPFFLFFMKKAMMAYLGSDYERGLAMLKSYIESGTVFSRLDFKGESTFAGGRYIGIQTDCTMDEVGAAMAGDFGKMREHQGELEQVVNGPAFSIYHKWDLVNNRISYTAALPVSEVPGSLTTGMISGAIPETRIHTVRHTGPYHHLGNAWATLYSMQRNKEFKLNKQVDPFEIYLNNPMEVPENELITDVNMAIK